MKKKDVQELHAKTKEELLQLVSALERNVAKMKVDAMQGKVKNVNEIRTKMKNIARMLTIAAQKKVVIKEEKNA